MPDTISIKEHFEALIEQRGKYEELLTAAAQRVIDQDREWTKERLQSHNDLLNKWREATEKDRSNFVSLEAFTALKSAFDIYKDITAKALTLAEGKSKGFDVVRGSLTFVAGLVVAVVASWAATKGLR